MTSALVHIPGLRLSNVTAPEFNLQVALTPVVRKIRDDGSDLMSEAVLFYSRTLLRFEPTPPPVNGLFLPHPVTKAAHVIASRNQLRCVSRAVELMGRSTAGPGHWLALDCNRLLVERLIGRCADVGEAKRRVKACILALHPDKSPGIGQSPAAREAQVELLQLYFAALAALEDNKAGRFVAGPVAHTISEAFSAVLLCAHRRAGAVGVVAAASVIACTGAASLGLLLLASKGGEVFTVLALVIAVVGVYRRQKRTPEWLQRGPSPWVWGSGWGWGL